MSHTTNDDVDFIRDFTEICGLIISLEFYSNFWEIAQKNWTSRLPFSRPCSRKWSSSSKSSSKSWSKFWISMWQFAISRLSIACPPRCRLGNAQRMAEGYKGRFTKYAIRVEPLHETIHPDTNDHTRHSHLTKTKPVRTFIIDSVLMIEHVSCS